MTQHLLVESLRVDRQKDHVSLRFVPLNNPSATFETGFSLSLTSVETMKKDNESPISKGIFKVLTDGTEFPLSYEEFCERVLHYVELVVKYIR